jgi:Ca2+-transporting ATPase
MAPVGFIVFFVHLGSTRYNFNDFIANSLLKVSSHSPWAFLPQESSAVLTMFWERMMKKGIVVKQMKTVETLGSATVICTGQNRNNYGE